MLFKVIVSNSLELKEYMKGLWCKTEDIINVTLGCENKRKVAL